MWLIDPQYLQLGVGKMYNFYSHLRAGFCKYRPGVGIIKILKNPKKIL